MPAHEDARRLAPADVAGDGRTGGAREPDRGEGAAAAGETRVVVFNSTCVTKCVPPERARGAAREKAWHDGGWHLERPATKLAVAAMHRRWDEFVRIVDQHPEEAGSYDEFGMLPLDWVVAGNELAQYPCPYDGYTAARRPNPFPHVYTERMYKEEMAGRLKAVDTLLRHNPDQLTEDDGAGQLALHRAVSLGACSIVVEKLIKYNDKALAVQDEDGRLPLHISLLNDWAEHPPKPDATNHKHLRDGREKPEDYYEKDPAKPYVETSWGWHEVYGSVHRVPFVLLWNYKAGARIEDNDGLLPLHHAAVYRHDLVADLVDAYPQGTKCRDGRGRLPLHYALAFGAQRGVLDKLCVDEKELMMPDNDGYLPLLVPGALPLAITVEMKRSGAFYGEGGEMWLEMGGLSPFPARLRGRLVNVFDLHASWTHEAGAHESGTDAADSGSPLVRPPRRRRVA